MAGWPVRHTPYDGSVRYERDAIGREVYWMWKNDSCSLKFCEACKANQGHYRQVEMNERDWADAMKGALAWQDAWEEWKNE